jgi:hypothetical protein
MAAPDLAAKGNSAHAIPKMRTQSRSAIQPSLPAARELLREDFPKYED